MTLNNIIKKIRHFRDERDWAQFHSSKDMAIAISIEANELLEQFLWKTTDEVEASVKKHRKDIEKEIADIGIYLVELADNLDIDLITIGRDHENWDT